MFIQANCKNWVKAKIEDLANVVMGQSPPSESYNTTGNGVPFFQGKAEFGAIHPTVQKWCTNASKFAQPDNILISVRAPVGAVNVADQYCAIGRGLAAIDYKHCSRFLYYYFLLVQKKLDEKGTGTTFRAISADVIRSNYISLPPLPEQHRIVAKIEELFASLDKGIEALKTAQQQLKVYRQAVLKYAFEGKLTHPELKEGELPEGWVLTTLQSLTTKIVDGAHHTPTYTKQGVPFISVKDIRNFEIDFSNTKFIDRSTHNELIKRCNPEVGDILITKSGTIGRLAIVPNAEFSLFVSVALLKIKQDLIESKFALYSIQNHINHLDISSEIKGGLLKNYHLEDLRKASICYVPQAQQEQVVKEIESRLSVCDKIDEIIVTNLQQSEALRQSILKKAFEGKLVPQDPNDEPASVLLERIRAGRVASAPLNKPVAKKGRRVKA